MLGCKVTELGDAFNKIGKDLNLNFDAVLALMGANANVLSTQLPDLDQPFNNAIQDFAASRQIPSTIIVGMQTGERASSEDNISFALRAQAYRENVLDYEIEKILQAFAKIGLWSNVEWAIKWDELLNSTEIEKAELAKTMSETALNMIGAGYQDPVYSLEEVRTASGLSAELPKSEEDKGLDDRSKEFDDIDLRG